MFFDVSELIAGGMAVAGSIAIIYLILKHRQVMIRQKTKETDPANKKLDIDQMLDGVEMALDQTRKTRAEMLAKGATPEVLKPLDDKIKQMEWIEQNEWLVRWLGPKVDKFLMNLIKGFK
jgi:hypothetical protein